MEWRKNSKEEKRDFASMIDHEQWWIRAAGAHGQRGQTRRCKAVGIAYGRSASGTSARGR
jgi:hypothetical protein